MRNLKDAIHDYPAAPIPVLSETPGRAEGNAPRRLGEHNSRLFAMNVLFCLRRAKQFYGAKSASYRDEGPVTWAEFYDRVHRAGAFLRDLGHSAKAIASPCGC